MNIAQWVKRHWQTIVVGVIATGIVALMVWIQLGGGR